jgi:hypothetical protein
MNIMNDKITIFFLQQFFDCWEENEFKMLVSVCLLRSQFLLVAGIVIIRPRRLTPTYATGPNWMCYIYTPEFFSSLCLILLLLDFLC